MDPLAPPESPALLERFWAAALGAPLPRSAQGDRSHLATLARAFARLPYENLTKILKQAACGTRAASRRPPVEVIDDHLRLGTGGTCFSLTAALLHLVRALGFRAEPILADRSYGRDTHCALVVWLEPEGWHLIDPGYLIVEPRPLFSGARLPFRTAFSEAALVPAADGAVELCTGDSRRPRLRFHPGPADRGAFLRAWDASFDFEMMRYPLLTRVEGDRQLYLRGQHWQARSYEKLERSELLPDQLVGHIASAFGLKPGVVAEALRALEQRSFRCGPTG